MTSSMQTREQISIPAQLQQGSRKFSLPAELTLADGEILRCTEMLRVLTNKRVVMKACWRGRVVLVKLMLNTASGRRDLRRELAGNEILKVAKIMTPELLLTTRSADENKNKNKSHVMAHVLVFEFVEHAQRFGDLWRDEEAQRTEIAAITLRLIANLHGIGCIHTDPHLDNFLLVNKQLYVIDVGSIKRCVHFDRLFGEWQRRNLAFFIAYFNSTWQKKLVEMLSQNYAEATHYRQLARSIKQASQRRHINYMKKCFRECSDFSTHKSWYKRAVWKRAEYSDALKAFLQTPDAWMKKGACLKDGNSATVVRVPLGTRQVVIKRNNRKNIFHWVRCLFRRTRARDNWYNAHLLASGGIATPAPIAFLETRWGALHLGGYYICAFNPALSLAKKYESQSGVFPTEKELAWLRELFINLRRARLYHGDLKASNLLISDSGIEIIDLDSVKQCTTRNWCARIQKDRDRFMENWKDNPVLLKYFSEMLDSID